MTRKILLIILIVLIIVVGFLNLYVVYRQNRQSIPSQSLPQPSLPPVATQVKLQYTFSGDLSQVLQTAPVYTVTNTPTVTGQWGDEIAREFGFTSSGEILEDIRGKVYFYKQSPQSLTIFPQPFRIEFTDATKITPTRLSQDQLIAVAESFLQNIPFLNTTFELTLSSFQPIQSIGSQEGYTTTSLSESEYIDIRYDVTLNEIPVLAKDRQNSPIQFLMTPDGTIRKATITLIPDQVNKVGDAQLTQPQVALEALNTTAGTVAKISNPQQAYTRITPNSISSATLATAEVILLYDYDTATLQPHYRFTGTAVTTTRETLDIEVLITALPQEVFK